MKTFEFSFRGAASLIGLLIFAAGQPAQATTYSDGGTHTVSGSDSNDVVSNGTTVNVVPGATVTGMNMDPGGFNAITVSGSTSALNVTGGSITGGSGSHGGGDGVYGQSGNFNLSGGTFRAGSSSGTSEGEYGGNGAEFSGYQSLIVSGGTFTGGMGYENEPVNDNGFGLTISGGSAPAMISGGIFGGVTTSPGALNVAGSAVADITGSIQTNANSLSENSSVTNINGNVTNAPSSGPMWTVQDNAVLNLSGGVLTSQLWLLGDGHANITGGQWYCAGFNDNSVVNFSGGQVETPITMGNNAIFNLSGGTFSSFILPMPGYFELFDSSVLNVYGTGLMLTPLGGPYYQLSGTLANGTPLPSGFQIEVDNTARVNLIQTPEPSARSARRLGFSRPGRLGLATPSGRASSLLAPVAVPSGDGVASYSRGSGTKGIGGDSVADPGDRPRRQPPGAAVS